MVASPTVPLPRRLFAHLRRWVANGIVSEYFVEWNGRPVKSVKTAFKTALRLAKVSGRISPHTLRHTAATWLMQNGVDKWEAAGFLGMSVEMLDRVYGHHHPEHLRGGAHALGYRRSQSLAITLAPGRRPRLPDRQPVGNAGGPGSCRNSSLNQLLATRCVRERLFEAQWLFSQPAAPRATRREDVKVMRAAAPVENPCSLFTACIHALASATT
jgi:hypothetical protein